MEQVAAIDNRVREFLTSKFSDALVKEETFRDQLSFYVNPDCIVDICRALHDHTDLQFAYLSDITSLDWLGHQQESDGRFEVVYNLYSFAHRVRLLLKVRLPGENPSVRSLTELWEGANWMEREVWDLMGIEFEGHPHLAKILTPDDFDGHPLRKDYPLTYEEPHFNWNKDNPPEVIK